MIIAIHIIIMMFHIAIVAYSNDYDNPDGPHHRLRAREDNTCYCVWMQP